MLWLAMMPLALAAGALLVAERRWPLRRRVDRTSRRVPVNLAIGATTAAAAHLVAVPAVTAVARAVASRRLGVLGLLRLSRPAGALAALVLLDYTLYWWHRLMHRVPALWRFHLVHHADLDLDVTTAARFHVAEYLLGTGYRALAVAVVGAGPVASTAFEGLVALAAGFHHASVRLPLALERRLVGAVVTPRMHGIHHSAVREETDSNWSTVLSLWDRLHGTLRLDVPQRDIVVGLPGYREPLSLREALALPFRRRQAPAWTGPRGERPARGRPALPAALAD